MPDKPKAGEVFRYPFLWKHQEQRGETGGRKLRPVCMAVTTTRADGQTLLFIVPLTTQTTQSSRIAIEVPTIEAKRANLDASKPCWVILDELNTDIFERSYTFEDRVPVGTFSAKFVSQLQSTLLEAARAGQARFVDRMD